MSREVELTWACSHPASTGDVFPLLEGGRCSAARSLKGLKAVVGYKIA